MHDSIRSDPKLPAPAEIVHLKAGASGSVERQLQTIQFSKPPQVPNITLLSGKAFASDDGESILDAALRSGVSLEHSCRTGRCGSCRAQVQEGQSAARMAELGLTEAERNSGWVLTCARAATSDVVLLADEIDAVLPASKITPAKIDALQRLSDSILSVRLRLPPATPLHHLAGQYVDVANASGLKRSYSLVNTPLDSGSPGLELLIRRVDGGAMSDYWLDQARPGDLLRVHGPKGTFFLRKPLTARIVLLATGTGIAPIKALLGQLAKLHDDERPGVVTLLWGNRHPADFVWSADELSQGQPLDARWVLSGQAPDWQHLRGRITQHMAPLLGHLDNTTVYACGSPDMISDAKQLLLTAGLPANRFHSDAFVSSQSSNPAQTT